MKRGTSEVSTKLTHAYIFIFLQVGLSLFVSNVGNATFLGIAGAASSRGFPVVAYEFSVL